MDRRPTAQIEAAFDVTCDTLRRMGIKGRVWDSVEFCHVDTSEDGSIIYRRKFESGNENPTTLKYRPMARAAACEVDFIGYVMPDGTIRQGAIFKPTDDLPCYVAFFKWSVAKVDRPSLNVNAESKIVVMRRVTCAT